MPLTPTATRELLARLGLQPSRSRGQNFLVDGNIVRKSLELAAVSRGDAVVEVGPGLGTLTTALLEAGAEVWAVELDRGLHAYLATEVVPAFPDRFHLMEGDAVEHPIAALPASRTAAFKVVANLPYAISTPWMDAVLSGPLPDVLVLMLQREAAERFTAVHGSRTFGPISIQLDLAYRRVPGHAVPASCFWPRPDVDSRLLHLRRRDDALRLPAAFRTHLRSIFVHRRKQLAGVLRTLPGIDAGQWTAILTREGCPPDIRAEAVPSSVWRTLALSTG